jgi:hypothetical protein
MLSNKKLNISDCGAQLSEIYRPVPKHNEDLNILLAYVKHIRKYNSPNAVHGYLQYIVSIQILYILFRK